MNGILNGAAILEEWKESKVKLLHNDGRREDLKNYRPISIISVICKLCMLIVRKRPNEWAEDGGLSGEVHVGFRKERCT